MKKTGTLCMCLLVFTGIYAGLIVSKFPVPAEYITFYSDEIGWKEEVRILADKKSLEAFVDGRIPCADIDINKYDADFFAGRVLVAVMITEPSGDIRHEVLAPGFEDGVMYIRIKRTLPQSVCSIKKTFVHLVSIPRNIIAGCEDIMIKFI